MSERRKRLGKVADEAESRWVDGEGDGSGNEFIAEAVAADVDAEYAPLLTIIGDIDRELWDDGVPDLSTVRRLIRAADDIRAVRKES